MPKSGKQRILVVDDSEMNREILTDILEEDFEVIEARDGVEAVNYMRSFGEEFAVVLLDIVMPRMDGFNVLEIMNAYKWIQSIPVIMISAENSSSYMVRAYELGAVDYIQRPFDATVVRRRVLNTIMLYAKQRKLVGLVEESIYEKEKEQSLLINILSHIVEFRNGESGLHALHIQTMTDIILQDLVRYTDKYKLSAKDLTLITTAAALHDIGKIAIDDALLNKSNLSQQEKDEIKKHTLYGEEMLSKINAYQSEPLLNIAKEICRHHHERYDGTGYPDGLSGDDIPISAQVVSIAVVYEYLAKEYNHDKAVDMILNGDYGSFNPLLLKVFMRVSDKIRSELHLNSAGGKSRYDVSRISREVIAHKELGVSRRMFDMVEQERVKYRFIASLSGELLAEIYFDPVTMEFIGDSAEKLGVDRHIADPLNDQKIKACLGENNLVSFKEKLLAATKEEPSFDMDCEIKAGGKNYKCKLSALVLYAYNEDKRKSAAEGAIVRAVLNEG